MARRIGLFRPAQTPRPPALALGFLAAYVVCTLLSYSFTTTIGGLAVLWICNGVLAAALLLLSRQEALVVALLCTVTDFLSALHLGSPAPRAALIAGCDLSEALVAAVLTRRFCGAGLDLNVLSRFRSFALFAALPATLLIGTLGASLSTLLFKQAFGPIWITWVLGDFLGMMIGAPAALLLARFKRYDIGAAASVPERLALMVAIAAASALIFNQNDPRLLFVIFPVGLLVVIRLSTPYTAMAVMVIAATASAATVTGHGPVAAYNTQGDPSLILGLQVYLCTILLSAIVLSSVLDQRARAQAGLQRALAASRSARRDAVDAAGAKGRFLAVMSHEMRTPLNGVAGHAQLLAARSDLSAEGRTHVEVLQASCQVLLSLINDVLDYSTTDNGQLRLETGPFAMAEVVRRTAQIVEPMLAGRPVTLDVAVGAVDGVTHLGDSRRVAQVLLNLLGNAVKYTERGHIRVEVERRTRGEADLLKIRVHDTGIGVAADKRDLLFRPFSQVDSGVTRNFDGAGLGLAISKSLVDLMGGQIGMRGEAGGGSEFWFEIPCPPTATVAPLIAAPSVPAAGLGQARILVVDDHPVNRQVASMMLIAAGFDVECAEDGLQAVEAVGARDFDMVFMDLHMPVMDGLTACRTIRALDGGRRRTPVVAVTAAATAEDVERCRAAGMDAPIAKPISYDALVDAVARYGLHTAENRVSRPDPEGLAATR
jgi:signal transduction histidine kinase/ActR/RegA family two-component response regulator